MRQGKKAVLVFQAGEGKQHGAGGPGGIALRLKDAAGVVGSSAVAGARHAQLRDGLERVEPPDKRRLAYGEVCRGDTVGQNIIGPIVRGLHIKPGHALLQVVGRARLELHQVAQAGVNGRVGQDDGEQLRVDGQCIDADDLEQLIAHVVEQTIARLLELLVAAHVLDAMELVEQVTMNTGIGQQRPGMLGLRILLGIRANVVMDKLACCIGELGVRRQIGALQVGGDVDARIH